MNTKWWKIQHVGVVVTFYAGLVPGAPRGFAITSQVEYKQGDDNGF